MAQVLPTPRLMFERGSRWYPFFPKRVKDAQAAPPQPSAWIGDAQEQPQHIASQSTPQVFMFVLVVVVA